MSEERFAELLRELAAEYNVPPETPREAMWAEIDAARRALRHPPGAAAAAPRLWLRRLAGLAAMLALGFAIGRLATWQGADPGPGAVADAVPPPAGAQPGLAAPVTDAFRLPVGTEAEEEERTGAPPASRDAAPPRDGPLLVSAPGALAHQLPRGKGEAGGRESAGRNDEPAAGGVYALVATQTLAQGEALLTAFRAADAAERVDPHIGVWAREILSTTRLLLDSPASGDATLRGLLEDLELVLVQIAHLSRSPADSAERAWIRETLRQRDMLPRLRTAVPAGSWAAGT